MSSQNDVIKQVPYGISDYGLIRKGNYYYVDKTRYLKSIESASRYLFLIRPRRFGKSLFVTMMEAYYSIHYKDRFEEFFKGTWIYENPTAERGTYLVLTFNFSAVDPDPDVIAASFLNIVRSKARAFLDKYRTYLTGNREAAKKVITGSLSASDILSAVIDLCESSHRQLYVIIDEYDNFANTLLSTRGEDAYRDLTHGAGFFRSFFKVLKEGTTRLEAPITRSFITGVSPITMDDVTSGYNIGENVSLDAEFNRSLGFTGDDLEQMLNYYRSVGMVEHGREYLMEIIPRWYGNYLFSPHAPGSERLYNSDMILYFLREYFKTRDVPDNLIDRNVRIDYGKLRHLIVMDRDRKPVTNGNFSKLREIVEEGGTSSKIVHGFPLEELTEAKNFKSLLFYLGLLTIKGPEKDKLRLEIPNETVKRLYYDYIESAYRETNIFSMNLSKFADLMTDMAYEGKWEPLFRYITSLMRESMSLRDLIAGEKPVQAFLNVYLGLSELYIIHCEKELNKGYADIVMEPFLARYEGIKYSFALEIKYLKVGAKPGDASVRRLKETAGEQLKGYCLDEKFKKSTGKTTLVKLVMIFSGHELVLMEKVE